MLANVTPMSSTVTTIFYAIAVVIFLIGAITSWAPKAKAKIGFVALGLAVAGFVFFWSALSSIH